MFSLYKLSSFECKRKWETRGENSKTQIEQTATIAEMEVDGGDEDVPEAEQKPPSIGLCSAPPTSRLLLAPPTANSMFI